MRGRESLEYMDFGNPPSSHIQNFFPCKTVKVDLNSFFKNDFLALSTKENPSKGWGYPKFRYGRLRKPLAFPRIYFPYF